MNAINTLYQELSNRHIEISAKEAQAKIEVMTFSIRNRVKPNKETKRLEDEWRILLSNFIDLTQNSYPYLEKFTKNTIADIIPVIEDNGAEGEQDEKYHPPN